MSTSTKTIASEFQPPHGSIRGYIFGFSASIVLTLAAYLIANAAGMGRTIAIAITALLATTQCAIQLVYFLHLGTEFKPRLKLLTFGLMLIVITIVVAGSLWIMSNLNSNMKYTPAQQQKYVNGQDGL